MKNKGTLKLWVLYINVTTCKWHCVTQHFWSLDVCRFAVSYIILNSKVLHTIWPRCEKVYTGSCGPGVSKESGDWVWTKASCSVSSANSSLFHALCGSQDCRIKSCINVEWLHMLFIHAYADFCQSELTRLNLKFLGEFERAVNTTAVLLREQFWLHCWDLEMMERGFAL